MSKTTKQESIVSSNSTSSDTEQEDPYLIMMRVFSQDPETHPYLCLRCSKRFSTTQALGGHQNAHKKEKDQQLQHQLFNMPPLLSVHTPAALALLNPFMVSHGPILTPRLCGSHYGPATRTSTHYHPYGRPADLETRLVTEEAPYGVFEEKGFGLKAGSGGGGDGGCSKVEDSEVEVDFSPRL